MNASGRCRVGCSVPHQPRTAAAGQTFDTVDAYRKHGPHATVHALLFHHSAGAMRLEEPPSRTSV